MGDSQRISPTIDDVADMFRRISCRRDDITVSRTEDNRFFIQGKHKSSVPIDVTEAVRREFRKSHPIGY